ALDDIQVALSRSGISRQERADWELRRTLMEIWTRFLDVVTHPGEARLRHRFNSDSNEQVYDLLFPSARGWIFADIRLSRNLLTPELRVTFQQKEMIGEVHLGYAGADRYELVLDLI